jgi:hypothetical protein
VSTPSGPTKCAACGTFNGKHTAECFLIQDRIVSSMREAAALSAQPPGVCDSARQDEIATLRAKVALMREMGVLEADGIKLGPAPSPPKKEETEKEWKARQVRAAQRNHDIMFAASSTKPKLRAAK